MKSELKRGIFFHIFHTPLSYALKPYQPSLDTFCLILVCQKHLSGVTLGNTYTETGRVRTEFASSASEETCICFQDPPKYEQISSTGVNIGKSRTLPPDLRARGRADSKVSVSLLFPSPGFLAAHHQ